MKTLYTAITLLLLIGACAGTSDVVADYDATVDFTQYKTFEFYEQQEDDEHLSPLDRQRLEEAVTVEFERRGIERVDSNAHLLVSLVAVMEQRVDRRALPRHYDNHRYFGYYYGFGPKFPWGSGFVGEPLRFYDYQIGALVIDVFDARKEVLVWEGAAKRVIDRDPINRHKTIPAAVNRLMLQFPVEPELK